MPSAANLDLGVYLTRFGLSSFRAGQEEVIRAVLAGRDCLCVMPTGAGKSLCYQLPALVLDGLTLVVSPLIALMKDQVDQLQVLGLPVTFINSTLPMAEQYARLERMAAGEYRLAYVVPERFRSKRFLDAVRSVGLKMLAVDEAHCISEWGHDFRPDYARLGYFRRMLGGPPTIALTATATDRVRRDIIEQLDLRDPRTCITGFARANLFYEVLRPRSESQKADMLIRFLGQTPGAGIIYASTRKKTEEVAESVSRQTRRPTAVYHAGLLPEQRRATQDAFMAGKNEIIVATNAFGMGIDKADVRFVVHYNLPGTLEAYYQEAGRAGRDGKSSRCLLLYHASDRFVQEYFIESAYPPREIVEQVYDFLRGLDDNPIELTQAEVKERLNLPIGNDGVGNCEQLLESAGVLERLVASKNTAAVRIDSDLPTLVDLLPKQAKVRRKVLQAVERLVGSRRNELIHFHARKLHISDDLDQPAVTHALRELDKLDSFTYIPPFRGRAIRMLQPDKPFGELEIDFEALDCRKTAEYDKLNRVIRFALNGGCRQQDILRYFGENNAQRCGHCDNCGHPATADDRQQHDVHQHEKVIEAVRMVLSGVARTEARFACGKNLLAQMLCGSTGAKMTKLGLNRLSTFGLLEHLAQPEVMTLIDGLISLECLRQVEIDPFRPVVQLTDFGSEVMRGNAELGVELPIPVKLLGKILGEAPPDRGATVPDPAIEAEELPPADPELLAALKRWRADRAGEAGVPPHYILTNATLEELARRRPDSPQSLLGVKGIGPAKLERHGKELLLLVSQASFPLQSSTQADGGDAPVEPTAESLDAPGLRSDAPVSPSDVQAATAPRALQADGAQVTGGVQPTHYWTWRLLAAGFTVEESAAIRALEREVIVDHALRAADSGWAVEARWCLKPELLAALEEVVGRDTPERIRPLLAKLPQDTRYEEVQLFLKCRRNAPGER